MFFSRRFWLLFIIVTTHASGAIGRPGGFPPHPPDFSKLPFAEELELSNSQRQEMKALHDANQEEFKKYRMKMKESMERFDEAMNGDFPDDMTRQRFQEMQQARNAMMSFGFEQALAMRKILTPKQREKFQKFRDEKFKKGFHRPPGPMGPRPDCPPPRP